MIDFLLSTGIRVGDDDDKIRLNQRKPSKYKGLRRFGPEKNLQRINKFMFEPLKMLADYKTNTDSPFLPDSPVTVYIRESGKTYLVRSDFSKMTKELSVKSDSILTVYFYPIVRKDGNSNAIVKTIEKERDTYVDGIYEIRYVDRNNPSY